MSGAPTCIRRGNRTLHLTSGRVELHDGSSVALTKGQRKVIQFLADLAGEYATAEAMLTEVWGRRSFDDPAVVHNAMARLRGRLEHDPRNPQFIESAYGKGYRLKMSRTIAQASWPSYAVPLMGRAAKLRDLQDALGASTRLLTILGPAGVGKSRLAIEALRALGEPVVWIDLRGVDEVDAALRRIAESLHVRIGKADSATVIGDSLHAQGAVRLVLDDAERIAASIAPHIATWLARAPQLCILATARVPLDLPEERRFRLAPLPTHAGGPAHALFLAHANTVRTDIHHDGRDDALMEAIVQDLDGLPLAIELAARRMKVFDPETLQARLRVQRFSVLQDRGGASRTPMSLRRTLALSHDLLSPLARQVLRASALVPGAVQIGLLEAMLPEHPPEDVFDAVQELTEHSWLRQEPGQGLHLLQSLRAFAVQTSVPEDAQMAATRLAAWLVEPWDVSLPYPFDRPGGDRLREHATRHLESSLQVARLLKADNATLIAQNTVAACAILRRVGPVLEGLNLITHALDRPLDSTTRARLWVERAALLEASGQAADAATAYEEAAGADDAPHVAAAAATGRARIALQLGALVDAATWIARARTLTDDPLLLAITDDNAAHLAYMQTSDIVAFAAYHERAVAQRIRRKWVRLEATSRVNLAGMRLVQGHIDDAVVQFQRAHALFVNVDDGSGTALTLTSLASAYERRGDMPAACRAYEGARDEHLKLGDQRWAAVSDGRAAVVSWHVAGTDAPPCPSLRERVSVAVETLADAGDVRQEAALLDELALMDVASGRPAEARRHLLRALAALEGLDDRVLTVSLEERLGWLDTLEGVEGGEARVAKAREALVEMGVR